MAWMERQVAATSEESMVDPFLVEALQNPRHRLTILRMELDVQRFLQNLDQQHFEFQHFPTSYLRLAAHRVAQHYGLVTTVQDSGSDGLGNRILVRKTAETRYPSVRLSEIPAKQSENGQAKNIKIAIKPRPNRGDLGEANRFGLPRNTMRSAEERKEDYDRARARIFNDSNSSGSDNSSLQGLVEEKITCLSRNENEVAKNRAIDAEKSINLREGGTSSRVAIFRDREKDRSDPDYDRSYRRYIRIMPADQNFSSAPIQIPFHEAGFPLLPRTQATLNYMHPVSPFCATGLNQTSRNADTNMQWPNSAMMYAHSYEQFGHATFQAPPFQQPLSFDYLQHR